MSRVTALPSYVSRRRRVRQISSLPLRTNHHYLMRIFSRFLLFSLPISEFVQTYIPLNNARSMESNVAGYENLDPLILTHIHTTTLYRYVRYFIFIHGGLRWKSMNYDITSFSRTIDLVVPILYVRSQTGFSIFAFCLKSLLSPRPRRAALSISASHSSQSEFAQRSKATIDVPSRRRLRRIQFTGSLYSCAVRFRIRKKLLTLTYANCWKNMSPWVILPHM